MDLLRRLSIDKRAPAPLYRQIAACLEAEVRGGRLEPGSRLPSTRELARHLGVNLVTVVSAYRELVRAGLASGHVGRGTFITAPPEPEARPAAPTGGASGGRGPRWQGPPEMPSPALEGEELPPGWDPPALPASRATMFLKPLGRDVIALSSGLPSADFFALAALRRAFDEVLRREGGGALQYQPIEGYGPLREAAAAYLAQRGTRVRAEHILICSGAVTGVYMAARFLTRPGDVVLTETPTYCSCLSALETLGLRLVGVPVDGEGMRVDVAERLVRQVRPRAIYTIPTYHNPIGVCLSPLRREALLALSRREGIPIIEEDYGNEIGFTATRPGTLKAMDGGQVIYVKGFSKLTFPAIRVAVVAAPPRMVRGLLAVKEGIDPYGPGLNQRLLHHMMMQPGFVRAVDGLAARYRPRRDAMCRALRDLADRDLTWREPEGGVHVWARLPEGLNSQEMLAEAIRAGVSYVPGDCFVPDRTGVDCLRLSFGNVTPEQIRAGVARLVRVVRRQRARRRHRPPAAQAAAGMLV